MVLLRKKESYNRSKTGKNISPNLGSAQLHTTKCTMTLKWWKQWVGFPKIEVPILIKPLNDIAYNLNYIEFELKFNSVDFKIPIESKSNSLYTYPIPLNLKLDSDSIEEKQAVN